MSVGDRADNLPQWLRQMKGWEETPEWLLKLVEQSEEVPSFDDWEVPAEEMDFESSGEPSPEEPPALQDVDLGELAAVADVFDSTQRELEPLDRPDEGQQFPVFGDVDTGSLGWLADLDESILTEAVEDAALTEAIARAQQELEHRAFERSLSRRPVVPA